MSFFSWMNLTLDSTSAESSMAWLNPFSPPYDMSTSLRTFACNLYMAKGIEMSKMNPFEITDSQMNLT